MSPKYPGFIYAALHRRRPLVQTRSLFLISPGSINCHPASGSELGVQRSIQCEADGTSTNATPRSSFRMSRNTLFTGDSYYLSQHLSNDYTFFLLPATTHTQKEVTSIALALRYTRRET